MTVAEPITVPRKTVRTATTTAPSIDQAVKELSEGLGTDDLAVILVFHSPSYNASELATALKSTFKSVPVSGCSTAGEILPSGTTENSILAVGFPSSRFTAAVLPALDLSMMHMDDLQMRVRDLVRELGTKTVNYSRDATFGLILVDGLSNSEEKLVSTIYGGLEGISLIGGSAGDGLDFKQTHITYDGRAHSDAAVLILIHSREPFHVFKCDHFEPMPIKLVVTKADVDKRIVSELNGSPAAQEYAAAVGLDHKRLSPMSFAMHPVVVQVGGDYFVRAIQKTNEDGSLRFFCAIDEGIVLTLAKSGDMKKRIEQTFAEIHCNVGQPQMILTFECIFRRLEAEMYQVKRELTKLYQKNDVVGFLTYGEQFKCMHLNQTFTGIAIGHS